MDEILAFADIGEFIDQPVKTYSSGMTMRLAFSVQTAVDPSILIVDEALSVGDELFQRKCFNRIEKLREGGTTVLFVSHDAGSVIRLCSRAILLRQSRVFIQGKPKAVVTIYQKSLLDSKVDDQALLTEFNELENRVTRVDQNAAEPPKSAAPNGSGLPDEDLAFLAPSLLDHKPLEYSNNGALISEVRIETLTGRHVNCIQHGREYKYAYTVQFTKPAENIIFGSLMKMMNGFEIGGMISQPLNQSTLVVKPGEIYHIAFKFKCLITPGTYTFNAGVVGNIEGQEQYLARSIDVLLFKVNPEKQLFHTGHINFQTGMSVLKVKSS